MPLPLAAGEMRKSAIVLLKASSRLKPVYWKYLGTHASCSDCFFCLLFFSGRAPPRACAAAVRAESVFGAPNNSCGGGSSCKNHTNVCASTHHRTTTTTTAHNKTHDDVVDEVAAHHVEAGDEHALREADERRRHGDAVVFACVEAACVRCVCVLGKAAAAAARLSACAHTHAAKQAAAPPTREHDGQLVHSHD